MNCLQAFQLATVLQHQITWGGTDISLIRGTRGPEMPSADHADSNDADVIDPDFSMAPEAVPIDAASEFTLDAIQPQISEHRSAATVLPFAFLAGLLLNFMPCVLPVVGLKLLSFVQQADSDRQKILLMNVAYTGGVLTVMMVLAAMAVFAGFGWGEQFSSTSFTVGTYADCVCVRSQFSGCLGNSSAGFDESCGQERVPGRLFRSLYEGNSEHSISHPLQRAVFRGRTGMGCDTAGDLYIPGIRHRWFGHGESVPSDRPVSLVHQVSAKAR